MDYMYIVSAIDMSCPMYLRDLSAAPLRACISHLVDRALQQTFRIWFYSFVNTDFQILQDGTLAARSK